MVNFDDNKKGLGDNFDEPIPIDDDETTAIGEELNKPIPFDDSDVPEAAVSHAPLDLGGGSSFMPKQVAKKPSEKLVSSDDRITGVKTFFTKLHAGALDFLDGQITRWLKDNPSVVVKKTNTVTGMIVSKKTEPNIIITIWY